MDRITSSAYQRPKYKSTKNGALAGAGAGLALNGLLAGSGALALGAVKTLSAENKREYIKQTQDVFTKLGANMNKTTVSKTLKGSAKSIAKPLNFAKAAGVSAAVGACIGLVIDNVKNHKAGNKNGSGTAV